MLVAMFFCVVFLLCYCLASDQCDALVLSGVSFSVEHSMESLILAQDERWRRA